MRRYLAPAIDEVIVRTLALLVSGDLLRLINPGKDTIVDGFVFEDLGLFSCADAPRRSKCSLSSGVCRLSPSYQPITPLKNMHEASTLAASRRMSMRRAKKMDEATAASL